METPTFIESYDTGEHALCIDLIEHLEYLLKQQSIGGNDELEAHFMQGELTNGGVESRKDFSFNLNLIGDHKSKILNGRVHTLLSIWVPKYLSANPGLNMKAQSHHGIYSAACKIQKTPTTGGFHAWHSEHANNPQALARALTWTLYLNDFPDGEATTEFLQYGISVTPKRGLLSFFPAAWTHVHRGNPPYSHEKYIATGWYYFTAE